jgi:iron complex transport system permease protein
MALLRAWWRALPAWAGLVLLAAVVVVLVAVFLFTGVTGSWEFALTFRARKIAVMVVVGAAIGASTVLFQTVTGNRILTPSIMGFDALYMLVQTVTVFFFGVTVLATADPILQWTIQVALMMACAVLLFRWVFGAAGRSLHLVLLVGLVVGVLFRSVTSLMQRMMDPTDFAVLQDASFASFTTADPRLLAVSALVLIGCGIFLWRSCPRFDVVGLGEQCAISLGVNYRWCTTRSILVISLLVATSTALVGPVTFLGLIAANLGYALVRTYRHVYTIPAAALVGVAFLVGGQLVLERVFGLTTALSIIIEFVGGIVFVALLLGGRRRSGV